jgi:hypothetical protein
MWRLGWQRTRDCLSAAADPGLTNFAITEELATELAEARRILEELKIPPWGTP